MLDIHAQGMRPLMDMNGICDELKNIVTSPTKVVTDYDALPEFESKSSFPELAGTKPPDNYYYQLEENTIEKVACNYGASSPELCIYKLRDVILYNGFIFTKRGEFFADIARGFNKDYKKNTVVPLGHFSDKYVITFMRNDISKITYYDNPSINFCTFHEYGHHLLESVAKLWISDYGHKPNLLLSPQVGWHLKNAITAVPGYLLEMVRPFNYSENDFIITQTGVFKSLYMIKHASMIGVYLHDAAKKVFAKIAAYYYSNATNYPAKIYISRKNIKRRKLCNENACEELFIKHGFTIIEPHTLSFREQVNIFANATHIAGPIGSGLHNIVFSRIPESVKLLALAPDQAMNAFGKAYVVIERSYNRSLHVILGYYAPDYKHIGPNFRPWTISLEKLELGLKQWLSL